MKTATDPLPAPPDFGLAPDDIGAVLEPWTVRTHAVRSPEWQAVRDSKARSYRRKRLRRALGSVALPWIKTVARHRDPDSVREEYSETWTRYHWPDPDERQSRENLVYLEWGETGYVALRHGLVRVHLLGIARAVEALAPRSVLEIGAGPGMNLLALSSGFPEIAFAGVELTASGVAAARSAQAVELPPRFDRFVTTPVESRTAHRQIDFRHGDARDLPFPDGAFDLVFTRLAVEQMEQIRDRALAEIHRVARAHAVFVEPFRDFNTEGLKALATRTKNYISLGVDDLPAHGFEPVFRFDDWPHKITNGAGLVVCRKA